MSELGPSVSPPRALPPLHGQFPSSQGKQGGGSWFDSPSAPWLLGALAVAGTSAAWYYTVGPGGGTGGVQQSHTRLTPAQSCPVTVLPVPGVSPADRVTLSEVEGLMAAVSFPARGISVLDFKAAVKGVLGADTPHGEVLSAWYAIFDADGDGAISGREFLAVAAMLAAPDDPTVAAASAAAGSGGEEEAEEQPRAARPLARGCSEADVARLVFDAWDANRNGVVSRGEVASALRRLPLSRGDTAVIMGLLFPPSADMPDRITRLEMAERTLAVRVLRSVLELDTLAARIFASRAALTAFLQALAEEAAK